METVLSVAVDAMEKMIHRKKYLLAASLEGKIRRRKHEDSQAAIAAMSSPNCAFLTVGEAKMALAAARKTRQVKNQLDQGAHQPLPCQEV